MSASSTGCQFSHLRKVQPGNAKGSQNVPALCAYHNTPGSTNFRFSSAVTAKLQHQLIHNQWRVSVFIDCMLGSQEETCTAFHLSVIMGWGMASGEVVLGIQLSRRKNEYLSRKEGRKEGTNEWTKVGRKEGRKKLLWCISGDFCYRHIKFPWYFLL